VGFARPRGYRIALRSVAATVVVTLLSPELALADSFQRDRTPLPSAVTGVKAGSASSSSGSGFGRLAIGLVVVLALIFAIRWLVRRSNGAKLPGGTGKLAVVATTPLGPNRAVHLLRVGPELVLLGSAEQSVTALRVYDAAETAALVAALEPEEQFAPLAGPAAGRPGFVDELRKRTARR